MSEFDEKHYVDLIMKWKEFWSNQTQNSKEDYDNYRSRASGIDANMKYHLADMLVNDTAQLKSQLEELKRQLDNCHADRGAYWKDEHDKVCGQREAARIEIQGLCDKLSASEARVKELEEIIFSKAVADECERLNEICESRGIDKSYSLAEVAQTLDKKAILVKHTPKKEGES